MVIHAAIAPPRTRRAIGFVGIGNHCSLCTPLGRWSGLRRPSVSRRTGRRRRTLCGSAGPGCASTGSAGRSGAGVAHALTSTTRL